MTERSTDREKEQSPTLEAIVAEAKRIEENCLHTSKSHFVVAHFWSRFHLLVGIPTAVLAAIAGTIAFASFTYGNIIAGFLSIIVTILSAVATFLNPKDCSNTHLKAGNDYDSLLTRVRIFRTIQCRTEQSVDILEAKVNDFAAERDRLNHDCPQPPRWAYKKAKKGIDEGEASYEVDKQSVANSGRRVRAKPAPRQKPSEGRTEGY
jgi:hypothetical protein